MTARLATLLCSFLAICPGLVLGQDVDSVRIDDPTLVAGIPGEGTLADQQIQRWLDDDRNHRRVEFELPEHWRSAKANMFVPADNPTTRAKIELGRQLFFDKRLSVDRTISCASCHIPTQGYAARTQFGIGVDQQAGDRNTPTIINRLFSQRQFWDGRAKSLEDQAVGPISNAIEMANTHDGCVAVVKKINGYRIQFDRIFSDGVNIENIGRAIACFERTIVTGPAPYDYQHALEKFEELFAEDLEYLDEEPELAQQYERLKANAEKHSLSAAAARGMKLFAGKAKCNSCHVGANFTDELYHNLGVGLDGQLDPATVDLGRFELTQQDADRHAFKTPTLRNIVHSPPYMHDGSQRTLAEVVDWYNKGGHPNPWLSDKVPQLELNEQQRRDLTTFMKEALTGNLPAVQQGRLPVE